VIEAFVDDLEHDRDTAPSRLLGGDGDDPATSNVWLRLLGAVHRLVLDDPTTPLAACMPTAGGRSDPRGAVAALADFAATHEAALAREMQHPVQTNEVGRSVALSAAMRWVGGELHLRELGASAGLNLWLDRYRVVAGERAWGPPDSPVVLDGFFASGSPPDAPLDICTRRGCDRQPVDLTDPRARRLLRSFVWPDHVERLARLDAAISVAGPVDLDAEDAVAWTRAQLEMLGPGRTVLYHSVVLPYLGDEAVADLTTVMHAAGERATGERALAWVALEWTPDVQSAELTASRWPERDAHRLAVLSPHGDKIRWDVQPIVD
jgi:hypothetical protein